MGGVDIVLIGPEDLLLLGAVAGKALRQLPQVGGPGQSGLFLGLQSGDGAFFGGDVLRQGVGLCQQLRLAGKGLLRLRA